MVYLKKGFLMLFVFHALNGFSQADSEEQSPAWQLNATYKGDLVSNFNGGIAPGTTYLGLADLFVHFGTGNSGWWKNGEFLVHGSNSHGGKPSETLIGDFQIASNIEAGNHTFLYELWYKQTFSKVATTIGLQDMNAEFANSEVASIFLNSSFGIHSVISDNISAPIFPLTSPGITICWKASDRFCLKTAIYKGCPIDFDQNPYNIKWDLNYEEGLLWITESQFSWTGKKANSNKLKTGIFFHQHCPENNVINSKTGNQLTYDYGFYLVGNHQVIENANNNQKLSIFYQLGVSPCNDNYGYVGTGCLYEGLFSKNSPDELGLAMAWGMLTKERGRNETTFELTYKIRFNHQIYVQPDLQYVVHPGGTDELLKNATVGLLRLGMEF